MRFTANADDMLYAVSLISDLIPSNPFLPVLRYIHVQARDGEIKLSGSDQLRHITAMITDCDIDIAGELCMPAREVRALLQLKASDKAEFFLHADNKMRISYGRHKLNVSTLYSDEFVELFGYKLTEHQWTVNTDDIDDFMKLQSRSIEEDEYTVIGAGILVNIEADELKLMSLSSKGGLLYTATARPEGMFTPDGATNIFVPRETMSLVAQWGGEAVLSLGENEDGKNVVNFSNGMLSLTAPLLTAKNPGALVTEMESLLERDKTGSFYFDDKDWKDSVKACSTAMFDTKKDDLVTGEIIRDDDEYHLHAEGELTGVDIDSHLIATVNDVHDYETIRFNFRSFAAVIQSLRDGENIFRPRIHNGKVSGISVEGMSGENSYGFYMTIYIGGKVPKKKEKK